ncbi:TetR/AcrR family transcriptional regulator [Thermoactinospora rubra]|uniref:TetR/AcrR family transcriptional regulator n=1 Tax=Thermoactinospora rubra TaxID=1088767 RepID=UPI000A0F8E31|nr:TetR/AcrR family transcriptional regulator [Thermoactinospora rubra]
MDPGSPAGTGRPYRSPRRSQAASDTRAAILAAATRLFVERGYGRVTVNDIAQEASVAVPTVYASAGGKSAILATIVEEAIRDPIVDTTLAGIRRSTTPSEVVELTAHGTRTDNERYHDLIQVVFTAATLDETAAATKARSDRIYVETLAHTADRLHELGALKRGLPVERATDILWFLFGHRSWQLLVTERGWSWDDAERWLTEQALAALLEPDGTGG